MIGDNANFLLSISQYVARKASFAIITSQHMLEAVFSVPPKYIIVDFEQKSEFSADLSLTLIQQYPNTHLCAMIGNRSTAAIQRIGQQGYDMVIPKGPELVKFLKSIE